MIHCMYDVTCNDTIYDTNMITYNDAIQLRRCIMCYVDTKYEIRQ